MDRYYFKTYLQKPPSFSSNYKSLFESGITKYPLNKKIPTKEKLEEEGSPNQDSKTQDCF